MEILLVTYKLSRLIDEWFLHADSDEIIIALTANLPCAFEI